MRGQSPALSTIRCSSTHLRHSIVPNDDWAKLARLAHSDPRLLAPLQHRSVERQRDLNLIRTLRMTVILVEVQFYTRRQGTQ
jgi:hypothetical protein